MYAVVTVPGVVGQTGGLSALLELPGPALGVLSFALVLLVGIGLLRRREAAVDRAVDLAVEGTPLAVVYGVIAFGLLAFTGGYIVTQLGQLTSRAVFLQASLVALGLSATALAGFGYLILGTWLTQIESVRRPWVGAVVGAVLSAIPWVALPALPAAGGWILLAAVGLGSVTRDWVHGERTVESESGG